MRIVYQPEHLVDAHLMRHVLEAEGMSCYLSGEHLIGGVGEVPAAGLLQLWVHDDDLELAQRLIRQCQLELHSPDPSSVDALPDPDDLPFAKPL